MAKLILKSIAYYPQALAELPMSHKDLGLIDTDKPYKKLIIPTQSRHLYRLVDQQTGQVLKAQKLIRDHNDLKVYVGDVVVVELTDFFSFENATTVKAEQEPLYMVDAGDLTCISGLISPTEGINLPEMYVLWEPGLPVQTCLNPNAMAMMPIAGLAGISGLTTGGAIGITAAVGVSIVQSNRTDGTPPVVLPKLTGTVFAGPVIGQTVGNATVSGLKVQAFDANGNSLGITDVKADGSYELELTNATYKGALVLKVFDPAGGVTAKYMDEATNKEKAFTTMLATVNYQGEATKPVTVNITALTNLAATKAGAKATDSGVTVPSAEAIDSANTQVAQKFLGTNTLTDSPVIPTVNVNGSSNLSNANTYGIGLALLSQIENVSRQTTAQVAEQLSLALTSPDTNKDIISYVNQASANMIKSGVDTNKIQTMVEGLGNTLATGKVSLSSNASPSVNLSTTAPDETSSLTAAVSNFQDANNTSKTDKTFSNPVTYQWQTSGDGLTWTNIDGDNAKTANFTLTQAQVGQQVRVLVKNVDDKGFDEYLASAGTKAVNNVNQNPAGSISIAVNSGGELKQGSLLSILSNSLTDTDGLGTLSYQWQSRTSGGDFENISDATFDTYTLTQAEVGKEIRLKASYTDGQNTPEAVFSVQTASVANVNDPPLGNVLVNGANTPNQSYTQGDVLTATNNLSDPDNNGAAITGLSYQWQSSSNGSAWTDISGATNSSYTLTQAEVGKYVQVLAKYADANGVNESKASESSARIVDVNDAPTGSLTISGSATENQTLTASTVLTDADNNGAAISGMSYQWQSSSNNSDWSDISGATSTTFTPGNAQVGQFLRISVSYTDGGDYSNSLSSAATSAVVNVNDVPVGSVTVSGDNNAAADYTQYAVLKAANNLTDADGMGTVAYKWQRSTDGISWTDIAGASTDSYTLTQADVGKYVHVCATYTDLYGTTETVDSATGTTVANVNDTPNGSVTVTGNMTQGTVLQAANTLSDLDGMGTVAYQWQISSNNSVWTDIATATGSSFTLTQAQTGKYVRVKASYTDGFSNVETVYNVNNSNTPVLDVMDAPVLTLTKANKTFTEKTGSAEQADAESGLFTSVNLSDAENNNISSITLSVSGLRDGAKENLVVAGSNLSLVTAAVGTVLNGNVTYSSSLNEDGSVATVTLTQTGGWTLADAQSLIGGIGYQNTHTDNPTAGDRSISLLQLVDNGMTPTDYDKNTVNFSAANSNAITATVTVQGVNDAPVLSGSSSQAYTENGAAFNVNPNINVSDVDSTKLVSAKVTIAAAGYVTGDTLSLPAGLSGIDDISASAFDASTRTLTLTSASGTSSAEWQTALRAVQFSSSSDTPGTSRSIDFVINDGTDNSALATTTVTVTPVNDIPVLSNASPTLAYTENATTVINAGVTVSDLDNAVPVKVTVAFTNDSFVSAEDQLLFTASGSTGNIAAAWNSAAGTLTLTSPGNTATLSQWNAAMQAVRYQNLSDAPSTANRSISFTANDGTDDSVAAITTVSVTAVNDAPVLSPVSKNVAYTEPTGTVTGASPVAVFGSSSLTLTDAESNTIKAFSLSIIGVRDSSEVLNIDGTDISLSDGVSGTTSVNGFTYSVTSTVAQAFTVSFSKTTDFVAISTVKSLLEGMTYNNTSANNPTPGARVITVASVQDSGGGTDTYTTSGGSAAQSTVTFTAANDAPTLTLTANNKTFTEGTGLLQGNDVTGLFTSATFSDAENNNIASITLTITNVLDGSNELLLVDGKTIALGSSTAGATSLTGSTNGLSYAQTWDGASKTATIVLSKTGGVALSDANAIVQSLGYRNTNTDNPTTGTRVLSVTQITDSGPGTGLDVNTTNYSSRKADIDVALVNDAPVNTVPASTVSVAYNSSTYITGLGVTDADTGAVTNFTVKLSVTQGTLNLGSYSGVTVATNNTSAVTLTGKVADIHNLLASANAVQYTPPADRGGSYTLTMTSNDAGNSGVGAVTDVVNTVSIAVNQPPVLGGTTTPVAYTENGTAASVFNTLTVNDADNTTLATAKVSITNYVSGQDVLGFANIPASMGNINGNFDITSGVMSLSSSGSTATLAQWQTALRAVTYSNSSDNPNTTPRTISYVINDGAVDSTPVTNTVSVIAVNDAPVASGSASLTAVLEDTAAPTGALVSALFGGNFRDVDAGNSLAGVAITGNAADSTQGKWQWQVSEGGWSDIRTSGLADTTALYLAAATSLRFIPTANFNGTPGALTARLVDSSASLTNGNNINVSTNGGTTAYSSAAVTLGTSINAVNDAPTLSATAANPTFNEGAGSTQATAVTVFTSASISTVEAGQTITGLTFTVSGLMSGFDEKILVDGTTISLGANSSSTTATNSMGYTVTLSGTTATVVLAKAAGISTAQAETLVNGITYQNTSIDDPRPGNRTFTLTQLKDNGNGVTPNLDTTTLSLASTVNLTAINDAPSLSTMSVKNDIAMSAFSVNGSTTNVSAVNVIGNTIELTLVNTVSLASNIILAYTAPTNTNKTIQDTTGNDAASIATAITIPVGGTYTAPDTLAPTLISATLSADRTKVILTYSESLYTATAPASSKFTVTAGADASTFTPQNISTATVNASNPNTVELQLNTAIANTLPFVTVSYTNAPVNDLTNTTSVQDPTGNDAVAFTRLLVPTTNIDTVVPVLRSATTSSSGGVNKLILTYSETLNNLANFTEASGAGAQAAAVPVFSAATVNAGEASQNITSLVFQVSGLVDGSSEQININGSTNIPLVTTASATTLTNSMTYSIAMNGTNNSIATVTLNKVGGITVNQAQSLITGLSYRNANADNPTPGVRTFDITSVTDSSGLANPTTTYALGANSASVLVTATNDGPTFSTNTAPSGLTTTNSQAPSKALNINTRGFVVADPDGGNSIETISFGVGDITPSESANSTNPLAPLNINFPNKPNSLYLTKNSSNNYYVNGTVSDLNEWLQLSNSVTYNPRTGYTGTTSDNRFKITDSLLGLTYSNIYSIIVTADTTAPVFSKAVVSREAANKIILSYDEPLNTSAANLPLIGQFSVAGSQPTSLAVVGTNIVLTMGANVAAGATVTYTKPASGTAAIQDVATNQSATTSTATITSDTFAPLLKESPVFYNGDAGSNKFILHFNEDLASASNSAPDTFKVAGFSVYVVDPVNPSRTGGATTNGYQSGGGSSFTEKSFAISFNFGFLSPLASIQVKYVDPGAGNLNALKDLAGNHASHMVLGAWTNDNLSSVDSTNFTTGKSVQVVGGQGNDTMTGGAANDTFTWFAGDAGTTTGAVDIVKSFTAWSGTAGDKLDISKLLTNGYNSGTSTLSQWVTSVTNNASGAPSGVSATNTKIVIDPDSTAGSSTATQTIWLEGVNLSLVSGTLDTQLTALKTSGVLIA